jgi:hypothetical protein
MDGPMNAGSVRAFFLAQTGPTHRISRFTTSWLNGMVKNPRGTNDSDFTDQTALMWYLVRSPIQGFGNTIDAHLGIRNWTQLNSVIDGQSAYNPNCTP